MANLAAAPIGSGAMKPLYAVTLCAGFGHLCAFRSAAAAELMDVGW
jgi:hypothetical protein